MPIAVILLFLASLVLIVVSRTTLMEQRISANEIRSSQALQGAQAGVDRALAYMQTKGGIDKDKNGTVDNVSLIATLDGKNDRYSFKFCDPDISPPADACPLTSPHGINTWLKCEPGQPKEEETNLTNPDKFATPMVLSCGWSDDSIANRPIVITFTSAPFLAETPDNPITGKGALNVSGSATVTNYYTNLTIWTGEAFTSIGNSGKTFVRNPTVSPPTIATPPPDPPTSCTTTVTYTCLT
ncbi:MAG: pilus assembly PilX N-terminal domain-containing protein [Chromatiaceae bacterium]|nr:pilus assembly PilX N-terminal domain-containing protein [Chromatiaceae bacterium]